MPIMSLTPGLTGVVATFGSLEIDRVKILIVGGAGKTGRAIGAEAAKRGLAVTAYIRDPAKAALPPEGVQVAVGDGRDAVALGKAMAGHDAVVIPAGGREEPVSAEIVRTAIPLMRSAGIKRLIAISAYGAVDGVGFYGWMLRTMTPKLAADKTAMEAVLRAADDLQWTAVRPVILTDKPATGRVTASAGARLGGMPQMTRADLAKFVVDELATPRFIHAAPVVS